VPLTSTPPAGKRIAEAIPGAATGDCGRAPLPNVERADAFNRNDRLARPSEHAQ
jgi:hypothetical protein